MQNTDGVRAATVADAEVLARLHLECWRETYSGLLSPAFVAAQTVEDRLAMWQGLLAGPHADRQFVAVLGGQPVGFAGSFPPAEDREVAELWGIYLLKAHHGAGLGQKLLEAALGAEPAALWVAEDNPRAQAFYRRNGFTFTGARETFDDWEGIAVLRMMRS